MNTEELKTLLIDTLTDMADSGYVPEYPFLGICGNLDEPPLNRYVDVYRVVRNLSKEWEKHSGNPYFPVPATDPVNSFLDYSTSERLWKGEQLELRQDLCLHLAKRVRGLSTEEMERFILIRVG